MNKKIMEPNIQYDTTVIPGPYIISQFHFELSYLHWINFQDKKDKVTPIKYAKIDPIIRYFGSEIFLSLLSFSSCITLRAPTGN